MVQRVFYVYFKLLINNIIYYFILIGGEGGILNTTLTYWYNYIFLILILSITHTITRIDLVTSFYISIHRLFSNKILFSHFIGSWLR